MGELTIMPALHGGFVVWEERPSHVANPPVFAGDGDATLAFVESRIRFVEGLPKPAAPTPETYGERR